MTTTKKIDPENKLNLLSDVGVSLFGGSNSDNGRSRPSEVINKLLQECLDLQRDVPLRVGVTVARRTHSRLRTLRSSLLAVIEQLNYLVYVMDNVIIF